MNETHPSGYGDLVDDPSHLITLKFVLVDLQPDCMPRRLHYRIQQPK